MDTTNVDDRLLHGIVLAAGDGRRVQLYVEEIRGEPLPTQYVNFIGRRSMLEHTFHRAEKLIPPNQILTGPQPVAPFARRYLPAACQPPQRNSDRAARQQGNWTGDTASADVYLQTLSSSSRCYLSIRSLRSGRRSLHGSRQARGTSGQTGPVTHRPSCDRAG